MVKNQIIITSELELTSLIENAVKTAVNDINVKLVNEISPPQKEFYFIDEASKLMGLSKSTMYTLVSKRNVPFHKVAKRLYFRREDLLNLLRNGKKQTKKEIVQNLNKNEK